MKILVTGATGSAKSDLVETICKNIANDFPVTIDDPSATLEVSFIDDFEKGCCDADSITHKVTLGYIVECLEKFRDQPKTLVMPSIPEGSFEKKLYSVYISYLPKEKIIFDLKTKSDDRGNFTEFLKTSDHGQFSVNISKPGKTKGQHWHKSKWEIILVVAGHGLIRERKIGTDPETGEPYKPVELEVTGDNLQAIHILPGYVHSIVNLSETEDLVTVVWANEQFDPNHPDTFFEVV